MSFTLSPITIDKITLKANQKTLLDSISLNITTSGISVIMGPNGAGKSMFLKTMITIEYCFLYFGLRT